MGIYKTSVLMVAAAALLSGCAQRATPFIGPDGRVDNWVTGIGRSNPLVGRIWKPGADTFVDVPAFVGALRQGRFILIGEKHDNPDHHRIQAWIVETLTRHGRHPAVAFEMFSEGQAARLARYLAQPGATAWGIGEAVGWDETGWPAWRHYAPIADAALRVGAPVVAANLPRPLIREISRNGLGALDAIRRADLGLDRAFPENLAARMREEIRIAHCNMLPDAHVDSMSQALRARDAHMASVMVAQDRARGGGAVLIAGGGHVRNDHGVPWHLARMTVDPAIVSIGLIEVRERVTDPASYAERFGTRHLPFDYVWFTPRVDNQDPCKKFERQLRGLRKHVLPSDRP